MDELQPAQDKHPSAQTQHSGLANACSTAHGNTSPEALKAHDYCNFCETFATGTLEFNQVNVTFDYNEVGEENMRGDS